MEYAGQIHKITSSGVVVATGGGTFYGVEALADGTDAATVTVYDNASAASGTILAMLAVSATGADRSYPHFKRKFLNGIYVSISAGTTTVLVTTD